MLLIIADLLHKERTMRAPLLNLAALALTCNAQINFGGSSASASFQGSVSASANSRGPSSSTSVTFGSSVSSQGRGFGKGQVAAATSNSFSSNNGGRFGGDSLVATFTSSSSCLPLSQCSSVLFSSREFSASSCSLSDGSAGSVCSHRTLQAPSRRPFR